MNNLKVSLKNDIGVPFNVVLSKKGKAKYITFYDSRYKKGFSKYGQHISKYYMNTLLGKDGYGSRISKNGIHLVGYVDDWYLDKKNSLKLVKWIERNKKKIWTKIYYLI